MKIIFLDVDGVLNAGQKVVVPGSPGFYLPDWVIPKAVEHLNRIIDATGAKLVISSTWRIGKTLAELREMFSGVGVRGEIIGKTENGDCLWHLMGGYPNCDAAHRGFEIKDWLDNRFRVFGDRPKRFIIIDDSSDLAPYLDRHVHTGCYTGLTRRKVNEAIRLLGPCDDRDCLQHFPMPTL